MHSFLEQLSHDFATVSNQTIQSLVRIEAGRQGVGAGTIVGEDGLIVTNAHVVEGMLRRRRTNHAAPVTVRLADGQERSAHILAMDADLDLAALRVTVPNLTPIALRTDSQPAPGTVVVALGYPWGVTGGATFGIVIEVGTELSGWGKSQQEWLSASLHLRPGHSGGPMVDAAGRLVGINTMMTGPDVGVAVPAQSVATFLQSLNVEPSSSQMVYV